ncbi:hypothetical protein JL102_23050 [Fulvivirga sp. 2943]|uniref:Uncharacterized protein n=1 Tax=Fulvivirga sediminis TaxID=2803949 RepID=A0A937FE15_9BACT|nr:hypothetical protein [Fulvivirga sediminis]
MLNKLYINQTDSEDDLPEWQTFVKAVSLKKKTAGDVRLILLNNPGDKKVITETWVGIIPIPKPYNKYIFIEELITSEIWIKNHKHCIGIYVFDVSHKNLLIACGIRTPVAVLPLQNHKFINNYNIPNESKSNLLFIGGNAKSARLLKEKSLNYKVRTFNYNNSISKEIAREGLDVVTNLNKDTYHSLLNSSLVIINDIDDLRNLNFIYDCIHYCTPIIISNYSFLKRILGHQYPLYYSYFEEIFLFLEDLNYVKMGIQHLKLLRDMNSKYEKNLIEIMESSAIYQSINETDPDRITFQSYDLSILLFISLQMNEKNLNQILRSIVNQNVSCNCEYIIWNSNPSASEIIAKFHNRYKHKIELKIIDALDSKPSHCIEAMASLVRSSHILFMNNLDVLNEGFIENIWQALLKDSNPLNIEKLTNYEVYYTADRKNDQYCAYLFQTSALKKSLLHSCSEINELRNSSLAFPYIFSKHMNIPIVFLQSKLIEHPKTQPNYE